MSSPITEDHIRRGLAKYPNLAVEEAEAASRLEGALVIGNIAGGAKALADWIHVRGIAGALALIDDHRNGLV